jgi:hypothetical protein
MVLLRRRRADVVDELFSSVIKENAARAVHEEHPIVYEQVRNKWKRILENLPTSTNETEQKSANPPSAAHKHNSSRGRGGTFVRGRGSFRGAQRGGHRPSYIVPQASGLMSTPKNLVFLGLKT